METDVESELPPFACVAPRSRKPPHDPCGNLIPEARVRNALRAKKTPSYCCQRCANIAYDVSRFSKGL